MRYSQRTSESPSMKPVYQSDTSPVEKAAVRPLLRELRLHRHADYQKAYMGARKRQSNSMSWFLSCARMESTIVEGAASAAEPAVGTEIAAPTKPRAALVREVGPGARVGLTVGKVIGKAHERNRIKRRMRALLARHTELLPEGCDLILHPRRQVLKLEFGQLEAELVRILHQVRQEALRARRAAQALEPEAGATDGSVRQA